MTVVIRLAQMALFAAGVVLLLWVSAAIGGWSPNVLLLATTVRALSLADYSVDTLGTLAPLSPLVTGDAGADQPGAGPTPGGTPRPSPTGSASASPSPSNPLPTPTVPVPTPTLPVPTPTLPVPTPTLPVPTPTLPVPTPTLPVPTPTLPLPTPSLP